MNNCSLVISVSLAFLSAGYGVFLSFHSRLLYAFHILFISRVYQFITAVSLSCKYYPLHKVLCCKLLPKNVKNKILDMFHTGCFF